MKKIHRNRNQIVEEANGISLPQLVFLVKKNVLWFLFFGALGLALAFWYTRLYPQKYTVKAIILVHDNNNAQATLTSVQPRSDHNKKDGLVRNQIGILSSFSINYQTLRNLNWTQSWFLETPFLAKKDLYKNEPYQIIVDSGRTQTIGLKLRVKQLSNSKYRVSCNQKLKLNGVDRQIDFEKIAEFGKPFRNIYVEFTLNKIPGRTMSDGDSFTLQFNDLTELAKAYQQDLKITAGDESGSNLIYLELKNPQMQRSIDYLNELGRVYIEYGLREKNRAARNTVAFIDRQIANIADSLKLSGSSFINYRSSKRIVDIEQQSSSIIQNLDRVQSEESTLRSRVNALRNLSASLNNPREMAAAAPSELGLNSMVAQLSDLLRQREVLSYSAQDASPQMISLNSEIAFLRRNLSQSINSLLNRTESDLGRLMQQKQNASVQQADLPETEHNLNDKKRDFDLNNDLYTYLLKKKSEAQISEASRDPDAKILDSAGPGTATKAGPKSATLMLLGALLGTAIPLVYLILNVFFKKRLVFVTDVTTQLRLSVVGNIHYNKYNTELPVVFYPQSEITESFRGLRMNVQYLLKDQPTKVIAIHSAIEGEGKTFVSSNLAAILAIGNKTVLLVDADLRKPRSHRIFKCNNDVGLSSYLNQEVSFNDVIVPLDIKGLSIVNSGPKPLYPSELLNNGLLSRFIQEANQHYEYIIFNTSPVSIVNDAMVIAPYANMNLFLLRMKNSTKNELMYLNQLAQDGIVKNMAVALNNVTNESLGILQQKRYGYYNDNKLLTIPS